MEREDLFDVDVETVICKYVNADEVLPFTDYVESDTYDTLLDNYYKVKKAYINLKKAYIDAKKIIEKQEKYMENEVNKKFPNGIKAGEYPKHEYCSCVTEPLEELRKLFEEKPPLGVKPCFIQAEERIKDLADAISRYAHRGDYEIIKKWAREICLQCEIAGMEKND